MKKLLKQLLWMLLLLFSVSFAGCNKDDEPTVEVEFTPDGLNQTAWEGTITTHKSGQSESNSIKILFITPRRAQISIEEQSNMDFFYTINGKKISLDNAKGIYIDLWLLSISNDQIQLRTTPTDDTNYTTVDLKRIY